jgi:hypothetical protein
MQSEVVEPIFRPLDDLSRLQIPTQLLDLMRRADNVTLTPVAASA